MMDEYYGFPLPEEFGVEEVPILGGVDDVVKCGTVRAWRNYLYFLERFRYPRGVKTGLRGRFFLAVAGLTLAVIALKLWGRYLKGDE